MPSTRIQLEDSDYIQSLVKGGNNKPEREDDKLYKITRPKAIEGDSIDGYPCCVICGAPATEVHHILPRGEVEQAG